MFTNDHSDDVPAVCVNYVISMKWGKPNIWLRIICILVTQLQMGYVVVSVIALKGNAKYRPMSIPYEVSLPKLFSCYPAYCLGKSFQNFKMFELQAQNNAIPIRFTYLITIFGIFIIICQEVGDLIHYNSWYLWCNAVLCKQ